MHKTKALKGPASKKERQRYKSQKGQQLPRKRNQLPSIEEMYKKIKSLEDKKKSTTPYIVSVVFSPEIRKAVHFVIEYRQLKTHPEEVEESRREYHAFVERIKNCNNKEAEKLQKAVKKIRIEIRKKTAVINRLTFSIGQQKGRVKKAGLVRHEFKNATFGILDVLGSIERELRKKKQ